MLRINKTIEDLNTIAKDHFNLLKASPFEIDSKIKIKINSVTSSIERSFYEKLSDNLELIITGIPNDLEKINQVIKPFFEKVINEIDLATGSFKDIKHFKKEIFEVFNYASFTSKFDGKFAYDLADKLGVDVCLYCNRQFTFTLNKSTGKTRPQFDHFYNKSSYPYLALSFFNLIPSCGVCNMNFKGKKNFSLKKNIHPFIDDTSDCLKFSIDIKSADFILGNKKDYNVVLKKNALYDRKLLERCERSVKVFHLIDLYNKHKDYISEIITKAYYYNSSHIDELSNFKTEDGKPLFKDEDEIYSMILGNYYKKVDLNKRPLSKLTKDIAEELGLIKKIYR